MTLASIDGSPFIWVGAPGRPGIPGPISLTTAVTMDAAKEASIMVGTIYIEGGATKTIDTTGSSSIGWRTGAVTFANAGTTVKVGIATVDTAAGPSGRAVNVADVITFDVSKSMTGGGGGITANAWQTHVPDAGTKTIANGDTIAICQQMTALGGADSIIAQGPVGLATFLGFPNWTTYQGGTYALSTRIPDAIITFSDGTLGWLVGSFVATTSNTQITWNNGSATKEYGNFFQFPFPVRVAGAYGAVGGSGATGDFDVVLYSDPLGTPVAQRTFSVDSNAVGANSVSSNIEVPFTSYYDVAANTPIAIIAKPTTANNIVMAHLTVNTASHMKVYHCGTNGYAVNRNTGAFAAQNSNKDRFSLGLLLGGFDAGGGGVSRARVQGGF